MVDLGTIQGGSSSANAVSADGAVVVGEAGFGVPVGGARLTHAFRWTSSTGMVDLGTLAGGFSSSALGVSSNGAVVVGRADKANADRAFRWTKTTGMQTVEDWLRNSGIPIANDITRAATATNNDGSVVVGVLANNHAFIARVAGAAGAAGGLVTLAEVQESLNAATVGGGMALTAANTVINGAHSRPLARRVQSGKNAFWIAGDWGRDDHGSRDGDLGLAELGLAHNFGEVQANVSLGQTWANQNLVLSGSVKADGSYLLTEALMRLSDNLWATLGGYGQWGKADLRRGYMNAGSQDTSTGRPEVDAWGLRARLDWDSAYVLADASLTPYADLVYSKSRMNGYTETGGGFPAHFDARKDIATELRLGINVLKPLGSGLNLLGTLEVAHRFEKDTARISGQVTGLFRFDIAGEKVERDWLRLGMGAEGKLAGGTASLLLNVTSRGEAPNAWLAASWQTAF
jgi:probable HAF family extracellular repeat protein